MRGVPSGAFTPDWEHAGDAEVGHGRVREEDEEGDPVGSDGRHE